MNPKISFPGPLACGALLAGAMAAFGHGGATGIVGERMMGMMMLSEQVKLLATIADDPSRSDLEPIRTAAEMIAMHAGPAMTDLFPGGSLEAPSEARPEIWDRWQEFTAHADNLGGLGEELGSSAEFIAEPQVANAVADETQGVQPPLSEWERMDFAWLMGVSPTPVTLIDPAVTAAIKGDVSGPPESSVRSVREIYADIAATCAACHAAFRR